MPESLFSAAELEYLRTGRKLARLATVGTDGNPHVIPVGWHLDAEERVVEVGGTNLDEAVLTRHSVTLADLRKSDGPPY